jgi:hypothetical protein
VDTINFLELDAQTFLDSEMSAIEHLFGPSWHVFYFYHMGTEIKFYPFAVHKIGRPN